MVSGLLLIWGIALIAAVIVLLDWFGRRRERQSKHPPSMPQSMIGSQIIDNQIISPSP